MTVALRCPHAHRHRQGAEDQHDGVEAAPEQAQAPAGFGERVEIPDAVNHVGDEQAAEEQDFGEQEHPHAEDGRLDLWSWPLKWLHDFELSLRVPNYAEPKAGRAVARRVVQRPEGITIE